MLKVGLVRALSICERAARLTPLARASWSRESCRSLRRRRRLSATRRPNSAAPTSSPRPTTVGRRGLDLDGGPRPPGRDARTRSFTSQDVALATGHGRARQFLFKKTTVLNKRDFYLTWAPRRIILQS